MSNYENYNPAKDADESKGHLCNSLNAEEVYLWYQIEAAQNSGNVLVTIPAKHLESIAYYIARAQATIWYLRDKMDEKHMTNLQKLGMMEPEAAYNIIYWLFHVYGKNYTNTELAVLDWFKKEAEEDS